MKRNHKYLWWCRHPLAFLVEAADDICYRIIDFEDGFRLNKIPFELVEQKLKMLVGKNVNEKKFGNIKERTAKIQYLRAVSVGELVRQVANKFIELEPLILAGNFDASLISEIQSKKILAEISSIISESVYHTFTFADYYDPRWMGFRDLRVINDDTVAAGAGFGQHPHRDMEIISYVLDGALEHRDSMGNGRIIKPGEFQYMAAGTGVVHSEYNPSKQNPVHFLQIWIQPDKPGAKPAYGEKLSASAAPGRLHLIASKSGRDDSIRINQDADLWLARFTNGQTVTHELKPKRHAWVHAAEGEVTLNGKTLSGGDAAAVSGEPKLELTGKGKAQVLLFDLN